MGTFVLKRKTFGKVIEGVGNALNRTVATGEQIVGGTMEGVGQAADSFVGKNVIGPTAGGIAGAAAPGIITTKLAAGAAAKAAAAKAAAGATTGAAKLAATSAGAKVGLLGLAANPLLAAVTIPAGIVLGRSIMKTGGKVLKRVGDGLKNDAISRTA